MKTLSIVLATALLIAPGAAEARERAICGTLANAEACVLDGEREDVILAVGPQGPERITVLCDVTWESYGPNTGRWVQSIVDAWC